MGKIRILIADDFVYLREDLTELINSQDDMEVVGEAESGSEIIELAEKSDNHLLKEYAYIRCATSNIKTAVRGAKTRKNKMFFDLALAECKNLNIEQLATAASQGLEAVYSYLETTVFKEVLDLIMEDFTAFEVWADNQIIKMIKKEKYTTTTITPIVAYILARENEIKVARILLVAKQNNLPVEEIKKRMRDMYV